MQKEHVLFKKSLFGIYLLASGLLVLYVIQLVLPGYKSGPDVRMKGVPCYFPEGIQVLPPLLHPASSDVIKSSTSIKTLDFEDFKTQSLSQAGVRYVNVLQPAMQCSASVRSVRLDYYSMPHNATLPVIYSKKNVKYPAVSIGWKSFYQAKSYIFDRDDGVLVFRMDQDPTYTYMFLCFAVYLAGLLIWVMVAGKVYPRIMYSRLSFKKKEVEKDLSLQEQAQE